MCHHDPHAYHVCRDWDGGRGWVLIWERVSGMPNVIEEGDLGCDSGDWDGDGDGDVIGGGGSEMCRSEMVVVQNSERRRKSFDVVE
ncbi:hypothetical protein Tco_0715938 [Tanacetum coccineum]